jgi:hypothetical protein
MRLMKRYPSEWERIRAKSSIPRLLGKPNTGALLSWLWHRDYAKLDKVTARIAATYRTITLLLFGTIIIFAGVSASSFLWGG